MHLSCSSAKLERLMELIQWGRVRGRHWRPCLNVWEQKFQLGWRTCHVVTLKSSRLLHIKFYRRRRSKSLSAQQRWWIIISQLFFPTSALAAAQTCHLGKDKKKPWKSRKRAALRQQGICLKAQFVVDHMRVSVNPQAEEIQQLFPQRSSVLFTLHPQWMQVDERGISTNVKVM